MSCLAKKKILFIAPRFFDYEKAILSQLIKFGAKVDYLPDRPYAKPWQTGLTSVAPYVMQPFIDFFYKSKLDKLRSNPYDFIFIINGQTLSKKTLKTLKDFYPNTKFVLYLWDSVKNRPRIVKNFIFFDKIFTFDTQDASSFNLHFRPLFFTPEFEIKVNDAPCIDLSFVATMHSDRYEVFLKVIKKLPKPLATHWYLYLQAKWVFYIYKIIKHSFRHSVINSFQFTPIDKIRLKQVFRDSNVILDIEHPSQKGLTIRTLETVGSNKKLITTNKQIEKYDFFRVENILVIDRSNPFIPDSFWETKYLPLPVYIYSKYKLDYWLHEVLC